MRACKESGRIAIKMTKKVAEQVLRNKELEPHKLVFHKKALVIGGGIAGIRAALDIADAGFSVVLVEKKPTIGGHMAQLGQIFPTMAHAIHILTPLMKEVCNHQNIKLLTLSEVIEVKGYLGTFHVRIKKNPRQINPNKCDRCNGHRSARCVEVCPVTFSSEFDEGLTLRKAIYIPFHQAVPSTYTIDRDICISCGKCAQSDVCSPRAVNLAGEEEIIEEDVGVMIVTTGYESHSQENMEKYGIDEYPDVITSLQFERLLSPEGPTEGMPKRPSDGKIPKNIAFILCDFSRDKRYLPYCNHISIAYLSKQAILFKKLVPNGAAHFLFADFEAEGARARANYEYLITRAQEEELRNIIQVKISKINDQNGKLRILGMESLHNKRMELKVDMAVLALPMIPSLGIKDLVDLMQIEIDAFEKAVSLML